MKKTASVICLVMIMAVMRAQVRDAFQGVLPVTDPQMTRTLNGYWQLKVVTGIVEDKTVPMTDDSWRTIPVPGKLEEVKNYEGFYEYTFWLIFNMLNVYARTQVKCAGGRTDMVVWMPDTIYVLELKVNGTAQEALDQINTKGYATPYATDGRRVVKAGIRFNLDSRTIDDWIIE